jgi:hypothetical protein
MSLRLGQEVQALSRPLIGLPSLSPQASRQGTRPLPIGSDEREEGRRRELNPRKVPSLRVAQPLSGGYAGL